MQTSLLPRKCPSCGSDVNQDGIQAKTPAEDLDAATLRQYWNGFFKEHMFFSYRRCVQCSLLFAPKYLSSELMADLYSNMPDNTAGLPQSVLEKTQYGYFRELRRFSQLNGVYGEIGPDIGLFTQYCIKKGNFDKFLLWEPNQRVHGSLDSQLKDKAYSISTDMLNLDVAENCSLSTLIMIHVLDHILDPLDFIRNARAKMSKGAILLIVTHDERSTLAKVLGRNWPAYCLQHPQLYCQKSMRKFLEIAGFEVKSIDKSINYFPITYLMKHALWAAGLRRMKLPDFNRPVLPLKLGNIITIAQKVV